MIKFQTTDLDKAREIVQWLIKNVGPQTASTGSVVRGEGWMYWLSMPDPFRPVVNYEINDALVDEHTLMTFVLKWS